MSPGKRSQENGFLSADPACYTCSWLQTYEVNALRISAVKVSY